MMHSLRKCVAAIALFVMMGPIQHTAQKTVYKVKDLGTLGGIAAVAEDISERGLGSRFRQSDRRPEWARVPLA
jgi:hypothetical protein